MGMSANELAQVPAVKLDLCVEIRLVRWDRRDDCLDAVALIT